MYQSAFAVEARGYIAYKDDKPVAFSKYKKELTDYEDVRPYRCVDKEDLDFACNIFDAKVESILRRTGVTSHTIYLTGKGNFRNELYSGYKSSRKEKPFSKEDSNSHHSSTTRRVWG